MKTRNSELKELKSPRCNTGIQKVVSRFFRDDTGRYVVGQPPNLPIIITAIGFAGSMFSPRGSMLAQIFSLVAFGAIFLWSYLEIMYGESVFRRILGAVVLVGVFVVTIR